MADIRGDTMDRVEKEEENRKADKESKERGEDLRTELLMNNSMTSTPNAAPTTDRDAANAYGNANRELKTRERFDGTKSPTKNRFDIERKQKEGKKSRKRCKNCSSCRGKKSSIITTIKSCKTKCIPTN